MNQLDFTVLRRADLNYSEFSRLCGCSRATARLWALGYVQPTDDYLTRVTDVLDKLNKAVDDKRLPLSTKARYQRDKLIAEALKEPAQAA